MLTVFATNDPNPAVSNIGEAGTDYDGCDAPRPRMGKVSISAVAGKTYWIAVSAESTSSPVYSDFTLKILSAPLNDNFAGAETISGDVASLTWDNEGATIEGGEPRPNVYTSHSLWYKWTAQESGFLSLSGCDASFRTTLAVYAGNALDSLSSRGSAVDNCSNSLGARLSDIFVEGGETYWIQVASELPDVFGTAPLELSFEAPPENDMIAEAIDLGTVFAAEASGDNRYASTEIGEPTPGGAVRPASVWYKWTAPASGGYTLTTCGNQSFSAYLAVYTAAGNPSPAVNDLSLAASVGSSCFIGASGGLEFAATGGTTYWIAVSSPVLAAEFTLKIESKPINTALPSISGIELVGEQLTATNGTWGGSAPITYTNKWLRCDASGGNCVEIAGATGTSYTPDGSSDGSTIRARIAATNSRGSTSADPAATGVIDDDVDEDGVVDSEDDCPTVEASGSGKPNGCPAETVVIATDPAVGGDAVVGSTLTLSLGAAENSPGVDPEVAAPTGTFAWLSCTNPSDSLTCEVRPETTSSYVVRPADLGRYIRANVRWENSDGSEVGLTTNATTAVANPPVDLPVRVTPIDLASLKFPKRATFKGIVKAKGKFTIKTIQIPCPASGVSCTVALDLTTKIKGRTKRLGTSTLIIPAGALKPLAGKLSSAGLKLFRKNKKLKAAIAMKGSGGGAGKATFKEFTITK